MIIYNTVWLDNLDMRGQANRWFREGLISEEEKNRIMDAHPVGFYAPSFWISVCLLFFTFVLISSAAGFASFIVFSSGVTEETGFHFMNFIFATGCFFMAEKYKRDEHYFNAGTDNALEWAGLSFLVGNLMWILFESGMESENAWILGFFFCFLISAAVSVRYADVLTSVCAFVSWFLFLFFLCGKMGDFAKALLPFISLANALAIYFLTKKLSTGKTKTYWGNCFSVVEAASLIVAYASVNYFVVREMSVAMFDLSLSEGQDIPFASVFYFLTAAVPAAYIYFGLKQKDRMMLRMGLLLVAVSIFTIRQYHALLPIETAMTVGGFILLCISYGLIIFLKTPKNGFTYENEKGNNSFLKIESLVIAQTFGTSTKANNDPSFGGGQFGGGGANGDF